MNSGPSPHDAATLTAVSGVRPTAPSAPASPRAQTAHAGDVGWSLDDAPDAALVVAASGRIVSANVRAVELFGFAARQLEAMSIDQLLPERFRDAHVASRARYRAAPSVRTMGADLDVWARRGDGTEFPVEISLGPVRHGEDVLTVVTVRDITGRANEKHHLRRVLSVLDASDDGVFIFDADTMQFSYVNDGAVRLLGYDVAELLTMTPAHLIPFGSAVDYRQLVAGLSAGGAAGVVSDTTMLRKDGSEVSVEISLQRAPTTADGVESVIALARDITARQVAELELRSSQGALRQAAGVIATDRDRIARELHDTVIQRLFVEGMNLQAALITVEDPEQTRPRLHSTIDGLDQAVKDLRMAIFSLQEGGSAPGALRAQISQVATDATEALGRRPRLEFDGLIETIPASISNHLVPVLREALANACRHARATNVDVGIHVGEHVTLVVRDDGDGIDVAAPTGHGLRNMAARAAALGGVFTVAGRPSGGTELTWRVPADPDVHDGSETGVTGARRRGPSRR